MNFNYNIIFKQSRINLNHYRKHIIESGFLKTAHMYVKLHERFKLLLNDKVINLNNQTLKFIDIQTFKEKRIFYNIPKS